MCSSEIRIINSFALGRRVHSSSSIYCGENVFTKEKVAIRLEQIS